MMHWLASSATAHLAAAAAAGGTSRMSTRPAATSVVVALIFLMMITPSGAQLFKQHHTHSKSCPISTFRQEADAVEKACCTPGITCKPGKAPSTCSLNCSVAFVPFYDNCNRMISTLFDGDDGREDGKAIGFDKLYSQCTDGKTVKLLHLFKRVREMEEKGCTLDYSEERADRNPIDKVTHNKNEPPLCSMLQAAVYVQCKKDCNRCKVPAVRTVIADCVLENGKAAIDLMCTGKHRRQLQFGVPTTGSKCSDVTTMNKRAQEVNKACCPRGKASCPRGLPTKCGPACGVEFKPFLEECRVMLSVAMGSMMPQMKVEAKKCDMQPTHPIITAIASAVCNRCGDGKVGGDETCDAGALNSNKPNACRPNCKKASCGDGIKDSGEQCDMGQAGSATCSKSSLVTKGCKMICPQLPVPKGTSISYSNYRIADSKATYFCTKTGKQPTSNAVRTCQANGKWSGQQPLCSDQRFYVVGGANRGFSSSNSAEVYDPISNTWSFIAAMGTKRNYPSVGALDQKLYVFFGNCNTKTAEVFDLATHKWNAISLPPGTMGRCTQKTVTLDGKIYILAGYSSAAHPNQLNKAQVYNPSTNTYTNIASLGTNRDDPAAAALGGKIYVAGGNGIHGILKTAEVYDPSSNKWSVIAQMGTARHRCNGAALGGKMYVVGGMNRNTAEVYDPSSNKWTAIAAMGSIRGQDPVVAAIDGKLYVAGGYASGPLKTAEVWDPKTNKWNAIAPMRNAHSMAGGGRPFDF